MTIKDIARQCGVSVSTVSRVLNDRPDVSPENRRKVLSAIQRSNYIPNNTARDLVKTKSDAIGLVVRGVSNPFYTDIIRVIEEQVTARGYTLVMQQIGTCDDEVKRGAMMEREKRLRGLILLGGRSDYTPQELAPLNIPYVCCSYDNQYGTLPPDFYASVSIADEEEACRAVTELYRCGHRRIAALVSGTEDRSISQLRYQGYVRALAAHGLPLEQELVGGAGLAAAEAVGRYADQRLAAADPVQTGHAPARFGGNPLMFHTAFSFPVAFHYTPTRPAPATRVCQRGEKMVKSSGYPADSADGKDGSTCAFILPPWRASPAGSTAASPTAAFPAPTSISCPSSR